MKIKKVFAIMLVAVLAITTMVIPVSAYDYNYSNSKAPYVRSWLDAINDYEVIDYYEYSSADNAYTKTATVNYKGNSAYYKTVDAVLTTALLSDEIGFDCYGNIWFITSSYELVTFAKGSKQGSVITTNVTELSFDSNSFVIGYMSNGNSYSIGNNNGNNGDNGNNGGNNGNNSNNGSSYPYLTTEDNKLTFVESSDQHHALYIEDGYLILNNIILYKHSLKEYGFTKNGVAYITKDNKLITYQFGEKKQLVKAKKVSRLIYDTNGFVVGYEKLGKKYSL